MAGACVATERMESPWFPRFDSRALPNPFRLWPGLSSCVFACFGCSNLSVFSFRHRSLVWCAILRCGQANGTRTERNGSRDSIERPPLILLYRVVYTQSPIHETIEKKGHLITATKKKIQTWKCWPFKKRKRSFLLFLVLIILSVFLISPFNFLKSEVYCGGSLRFSFSSFGICALQFIPKRPWTITKLSPLTPCKLHRSQGPKDLTHARFRLPPLWCNHVIFPGLVFPQAPKRKREGENIFEATIERSNNSSRDLKRRNMRKFTRA